MRKFMMMASAAALMAGCGQNAATDTHSAATDAPASDAATASKYIAEPLVKEIYTADPSAHVWADGRLYIYPSHDYDAGVPEDDLGSHFAMRDYRVLSMDKVGGKVTIGDVALDEDDVPWVGRQMWAPDAAFKDGTYYLYFPAKDKEDVFRIGVATSSSPTGPFTAQPEPIAGSYSIDPAVFKDDDGSYYMYFGGIWGGQLQRWATGAYNADPDLNTDLGDDSAPALTGKVAKLTDDMLEFAETPRDAVILDENGKPLLTGDHDRRYFEGPWMFKKDGVYYYTYSTGDTHYLVYATGDNPYGPFTYQGRILEPVEGWTTHASIFKDDGKWWLAYHDVELSGKTHLRNVKITELKFNDDGTIVTIHPMKE